MQTLIPFDLLIERVAEHYRARILRSEHGEACLDFDLPFLEGGSIVPDEVARHSRDLRRRLSDKELEPRVLGTQLFHAVFKDSIGSLFRQCRHTAASRGQLLRIRLRLTDVPELGALPWETLFDPQENEHLAMQRDLSLVRYLEFSGSSTEWVFEAPVRVLAVVSSPLGLSKLDVDAEWQNLETSFAPLIERRQAVLEQLRPGTLEALLERLDQEPYHVLHFMGHGELDPRRETGELMLESDDGGCQPLEAHRLATAVRRCQTMRLVVLNVCEGASQSKVDAFSGLAQSLLRHGVPAVVGMQERIADRTAILFTQSFYEALAAHQPIDVAVTSAREELYMKDKGSVWALPVVYLRSTSTRDGQLTDAEPSPAATVPAQMLLPQKALSPPSVALRGSRPYLVAGVVALLAAAVVFLPRLFSASDIRCPSPHGLEMALVYVPKGYVRMGVAEPDQNETLFVERSVEAFCIGKREVTQGEWIQMMKEELVDIRYPDPQQPLTCSYEDAQRFIDRLNDGNEGSFFSLPTEAQWEYAARAGSEDFFSFGNDEKQLEHYGNCLSISGADGYDGTAPIGSFKPNAWGIYDMHGNVREWVLEDPTLPVDTEESAEVIEEAADGEPAPRWVVRGGSFRNLPRNCYSASRRYLSGRGRDTGFRVVRNLPSSDKPE